MRLEKHKPLPRQEPGSQQDVKLRHHRQTLLSCLGHQQPAGYLQHTNMTDIEANFVYLSQPTTLQDAVSQPNHTFEQRLQGL